MADDTTRESFLDRFFNCVHSGVEWSSNRFKSACPPKKEKLIEDYTEPNVEKAKEEIEEDSPCSQKPSYILPSQVCPKTVSCCYIKMQDPYAPCCCDTKPRPPPCPPKYYRQEPQELTCGCDLCKKRFSDSKCCDQIAPFRNVTRIRKFFEKA